MSRCLFCVWGMLFLLSEVNPRVSAAEMTVASDASLPIASADLQPNVLDVTFENYRLELGNVSGDQAFAFGNDDPSPLFTSPSISASQPGDNPSPSEWDYLWRNASRIPITSIPEPSTSSLLIGSLVLLWQGRTRKAKTGSRPRG